MSLLPPSLEDRYELLAILGEGSMGAVLKVEDRRLGRISAMKLIRGVVTEDARRRFARETEALSRVRHPNIVEVYDSGETPEGPFMVMELLEGTPLAKTLPREDALEIMIQVAGALDAIHAAGVVHRDLKPANVVLTRDGRPVLVDFGLVRDDSQTRLTKSGALVGTLPYLSPEAIRDGTSGEACDWWAWGVTLFELLEGRRPFSQVTLMELATGRALPPLPEGSRETSSRTAALVRRALHPDPGQRPRSRADVEQILREAPGHPDSPSAWTAAIRPRRRGGLLALSTVLALALGVALFQVAGTGNEAPRPVTAPVPAAPPEAPGYREQALAAVEILLAGHRLPSGEVPFALRGEGYAPHLAEIVRELQDSRITLRWSRAIEALGRWWGSGPDLAEDREALLEIAVGVAHLRHDLGMIIALVAEQGIGGATQRDAAFTLELDEEARRDLDVRLEDLLLAVEGTWVSAIPSLADLPPLALGPAVTLAAQFVRRHAQGARPLLTRRLRGVTDPDERFWLAYAASAVASPLRVSGTPDYDCEGQKAAAEAAFDALQELPRDYALPARADLAGELLRSIILRRQKCGERFDPPTFALFDRLVDELREGASEAPGGVAAVAHWASLSADLTLLLDSGADILGTVERDSSLLGPFSTRLKELRDQAHRVDHVGR